MQKPFGGYKNLIVWQKSVELTVLVYKLVQSFPQTELYVMISQIKRAATSISANIAEGSRRFSKKDFCHFLQIAFGSASELESHLEISRRLYFGKKEAYEPVEKLLDEVLKMLNTMIMKSRAI